MRKQKNWPIVLATEQDRMADVIGPADLVKKTIGFSANPADSPIDPTDKVLVLNGGLHLGGAPSGHK
jgi:hypothetical protein